MVQLASLADVEQVLEALIERGYARRLERRPGQKEERFAQVLGGPGAAERPAAAPAPAAQASPAPTPATASPAPAPVSASGSGTAGEPLIARLTALEARVEQLAGLLEELTGESLT
jgi:uncharacterized protein YceH (UPF0502 family)